MGAVRLPWRTSTASRTTLLGAVVVADAVVEVGVGLEVVAAGEPARFVAVVPPEPSEQPATSALPAAAASRARRETTRTP
jgi:hypothetical protein